MDDLGAEGVVWREAAQLEEEAVAGDVVGPRGCQGTLEEDGVGGGGGGEDALGAGELC